MGKKREMKLYIGLHWRADGRRAPAADFAPFLEEFAGSPLNWVLPAGPALERLAAGRDELVAEIKARLVGVGDAVIPAGYSGAPLPLLGAGEVVRELEWSLSNPWGSGLADVFKKSPDVLIPAAADFSRDEVTDLYARQGFRFIGVPLGPEAPAYRFWGKSPARDLAVFHYYDFPGRADSNSARLARSFFPRDLERAFLLVRAGGRETLAALAALLAELRKRSEVALAAFEGPAGPPRSPAGDHPPAPAALADAPVARVLREKAGRLRAKEKLKNHELRELLLLTAGDPAEAEKVRTALTARAVSREGTAYTANMPGEILLPGSDIDAYFSGGRLIDLRSDRASCLPGRVPRPWATVGGKALPLLFDRIFSFEKNDLRGLEAFVLFPGPEREHFFTLRYAFSGESPWLFVSGELRRRFSLPAGGLEAIVPLAIPLGDCSSDAPLVLRRLYADGSCASTALAGDEGTAMLAGTVFSVPCGTRRLVFGYVPHKSAPVHLLEIGFVRDKKRRIAFLNPFGTARLASLDSFLEAGETRSFYIGVRDEEPEKPPYFSSTLLKSIPSHALFKLE